MTKLFRARVRSRIHDAERIVFFEAFGRDQLDHVEEAVCYAWNVPAEDLEVYDLLGEQQLLQLAAGKTIDGDLRLLEIGFEYGSPTYPRPEDVQLLVSPATQNRLHMALARLPSIRRPVGGMPRLFGAAA
ncbi:hypothetical protein [Caldimonas sp. KR1-144]|uniref:hypothetical protein n=1 Tax=Caldimonas sp. KR1-144 TaxID=3400911 RepID=UPI003C1267BB